MDLLQAAVLAWSVTGVGSEAVLLDFYTDGCLPCRQMNPVVDQLVAKGYLVKRVHFGQNQPLAASYGVSMFPTFLMVVDGKVVDQQIGATSFARLEQMCKKGLALEASRQAPPVAIPPRDAPKALPGPAYPPSSPLLPPNSLALDRVSDAHLAAATVRLRIRDSSGYSCGSGTIIDARGGEALILTCGHIFRDSQGKGPIEVDLFGPTPARKIPGRLLMYDDKLDIGLLAIQMPGPVTVARVAPPDHRVSPDDRVINVGCNNGDDPTVRHARVTALNRYLGPPNLEVSGSPVEGRSGGGLFSQEGTLIGICNAADPSANEGLYAALELIHQQLDRAELAFVYSKQNENPGEPLALNDPPSMPQRMPAANDPGGWVEDAELLPPLVIAQTGEATPQTLSPEERAALDEIRQRQAEGAEVIFLIRPLSDPLAPSEIFRLEHASPAFLRELALKGGGPLRPEARLGLEETGTVGRQRSEIPIVPSSRIVPIPPRPRSNWQPRWIDSGPDAR
jgi:thiol-disulfide isomerase/thioredoxin